MNTRLLELLSISLWVSTFVIGDIPDKRAALIRSVVTLVGMTATVPKLYSGIVKRETPSDTPTLDSVLIGVPVVNLVVSDSDLAFLSYPGCDALEVALESGHNLVGNFVLSADQYSDSMLSSKYTLLVRNLEDTTIPTVYIGTEAQRIANRKLPVSIPVLWVQPGSDYQQLLQIR